jgi:DNA-binding Lrp family transcriptional regulator
MKKNDILLLHHIRKNARTTMSDVHRQTKISIGHLFKRLDLLEKDVISRYSSLMDFSKLNYPIRVMFTLKMHKDTSSLYSLTKNSPNLNSFYNTNEGTDFIIDAYFKNMKELLDFKNSLVESGAQDVRSHHVLEHLKAESFLADENI